MKTSKRKKKKSKEVKPIKIDKMISDNETAVQDLYELILQKARRIRRKYSEPE